MIVIVAHQEVVSKGGGVDHSLGPFVAAFGYLLMAVAVRGRGPDSPAGRGDARQHRPLHELAPGPARGGGGIRRDFDSHDVCRLVLAATARSQVPRSAYAFHRIRARTTSDAVHDLARLGAPRRRDDHGRGRELSAASGAGLGRRQRLGVVGVVLTLITLYGISKIGADNNVDSATGAVAEPRFRRLVGAAWGSACWRPRGSSPRPRTVGGIGPPTQRWRSHDGYLGCSELRRSTTKTALMIGIAIALFFPPTMTDFWQKVLVSEIGVYVLLAVGLNVVVGWAGLLDLGYIAFYAIGSYTTAYLVGSLPREAAVLAAHEPAAARSRSRSGSACSPAWPGRSDPATTR